MRTYDWPRIGRIATVIWFPIGGLLTDPVETQFKKIYAIDASWVWLAHLLFIAVPILLGWLFGYLFNWVRHSMRRDFR